MKITRKSRKRPAYGFTWKASFDAYEITTVRIAVEYHLDSMCKLAKSPGADAYVLDAVKVMAYMVKDMEETRV